ncbi:MAG: tetratricopeptide repeat protein [Proteobacteria bacterium]|nr:tetratricopeptide repeat protein [Pseudomonadota bacterium]
MPLPWAAAVLAALLFGPAPAGATSATAWYRQGLTAWRQGRLEAAERRLTRAIIIRPRWAAAYVARGRVRAAGGRYREAAADLTRALKLDHDSAETYAARADVFLKMRRRQRAVADYSRAIRLRPRYLSYRLDRAAVYLRQGRYLLAVIDYNRVIRGRPRLAKAHYNRGLAYYRWGKLKSARRDLTRAIRLGPTHQAFNQRGNVHFRRGRFGLAAADYRRGLEMAPRQARLWSNLCGTLVAQKKYRQALTACDRAIDLDPRLSAAFNNRTAARQGLARSRSSAARPKPEDHRTGAAGVRGRIPADGPGVGPRSGWYSVQVGAFQNRNNAVRLAAKLRRRFGSAWVRSNRTGRGPVYRVLVTSSPTKVRARRQVRRLKRAGFKRAFAVRLN